VKNLLFVKKNYLNLLVRLNTIGVCAEKRDKPLLAHWLKNSSVGILHIQASFAKPLPAVLPSSGVKANLR